MLWYGPWDFAWACEAVFILHEDSPMRRLIASSFIYKYDGQLIRRQRIKDNLSAFTPPDFNDVVLHVFIFFVAGAKRNIVPRDFHFVPVVFIARRDNACCRHVIWGNGQLVFIGIKDLKALWIARDLEELCVDPALALAIHHDPIIGIRAADEFDISAFV